MPKKISSGRLKALFPAVRHPFEYGAVPVDGTAMVRRIRGWLYCRMVWECSESGVRCFAVRKFRECSNLVFAVSPFASSGVFGIRCSLFRCSQVPGVFEFSVRCFAVRKFRSIRNSVFAVLFASSGVFEFGVRCFAVRKFRECSNSVFAVRRSQVPGFNSVFAVS